jgi:hypothetical protein
MLVSKCILMLANCINVLANRSVLLADAARLSPAEKKTRVADKFKPIHLRVERYNSIGR